VEEVNRAALDSLVGRAIDDWTIGDDGIHFHMNDGKTAIISGIFWIAIMDTEDEVLH
jgi:hypothetical protein